LDGHIKLCDFGIAKILDGNYITHSFCGSPEYMAPEMVSGEGHSFTLDYYQLGAVLYTLITGEPPFYTQNQSKLYE